MIILRICSGLDRKRAIDAKANGLSEFFGNAVKIIRSSFYYAVLIISTVLFGSAAIITAFVTRNSNWAHLIGRSWGSVNLWAAGVKVRLKGLENLAPRQAYVFLSNHQGWFDIFTLLGKLPVQFRWLAKEELFKIPILGPAMRAAGYVPIDRGDRRKAVESLNVAATRVQSGTSVVIFPEGTRSPDGVLQEFKKGGFILAIKSQQLIAPITISGSHCVLPKRGDWKIQPGVIEVTIGKPISTMGLTIRDNDALMHTVRESIRQHLTPEEGGPLPEHELPMMNLSLEA
jgi:1-acyl-sn-glycerol-3-phosphate acyltransferase